MEEREQEDVQLPDDRVEDLEPDAEQADAVEGGKYSDIELKRGMDQ